MLKRSVPYNCISICVTVCVSPCVCVQIASKYHGDEAFGILFEHI